MAKQKKVRITDFEKQIIVEQLNSNQITFDEVLQKYNISLPTLRNWLASTSKLKKVYFSGADIFIIENILKSIDKNKSDLESIAKTKNKIYNEIKIYDENNRKLKNELSKNITKILNAQYQLNKELCTKENKIINLIKNKIQNGK